MECFNCFQPGHCDWTMWFKNEPSRKPLHFCKKSCMEAFKCEDMRPKLIAKNDDTLVFITAVLEMLKLAVCPELRQELQPLKKPFVVEKMLRTSLAARKPRAECMRLYHLWKDCATEALGIISDKEYIESAVLKWAEVMKSHDKVLPIFIDCLAT